MVAVIVAVRSLAKLPAVAVNVAVLDAGPTVTVGGTVRDGSSLVSVTVPPPVFDRVTVQVLVPPGANVSGVQERPLSVTATASEILTVCVTLPMVAVIVAVRSLAKLPAVAVNVALLDVAPTVTDGGTVRDGSLSASVTVPPPAFDRVTV